MTRTLTTCDTLPKTGWYITVPFPDFAKPVPGGWNVQVGLRSTAVGSGEATVMVVQAGHLLASERVTPTSSSAPVSLDISDENISLATTSLCHVSGPTVIVSGDAHPVCCEGASIPPLLYGSCGVEFGGRCDCSGSAAATPFIFDGVNKWTSSPISFCGRTYSAILVCENGEWNCYLSGCPFPDLHLGTRHSDVVCDPFQASFMWLDSLIAGTDAHCCDPVVPYQGPESLIITISQ